VRASAPRRGGLEGKQKARIVRLRAVVAKMIAGPAPLRGKPFLSTRALEIRFATTSALEAGRALSAGAREWNDPPRETRVRERRKGLRSRVARTKRERGIAYPGALRV